MGFGKWLVWREWVKAFVRGRGKGETKSNKLEGGLQINGMVLLWVLLSFLKAGGRFNSNFKTAKRKKNKKNHQGSTTKKKQLRYTVKGGGGKKASTPTPPTTSFFKKTTHNLPKKEGGPSHI